MLARASLLELIVGLKEYSLSVIEWSLDDSLYSLFRKRVSKVVWTFLPVY